MLTPSGLAIGLDVAFAIRREHQVDGVDPWFFIHTSHRYHAVARPRHLNNVAGQLAVNGPR
jgi:hypothetical protein